MAFKIIRNLAMLLFVVIVFGVSFLYFDFLPSPLPEHFPPALSSQVVDRQGKTLRLFTTSAGYWRLPVQLDEVDPEFIRLLLACEDKRFWSHIGVDPFALVRALGQWIRQGRIVSGASTITMQTVRLLQPRPRTFWSKVVEMVQALRLERLLSKEEILTSYLTLAPYGGNIEGIEAAAWFYFQKSAARLSPSEAALLISLPQSPERRRPDRHPEQALAGRNRILLRLAQQGLLSANQVAIAQTESIPQQRVPAPFLAPHLTQRLYGASSEQRIESSLDARIQQQVEALAQAAQRNFGPEQQQTLALMVVENSSRLVLAHVGSGDYWKNRLDLTHARRSPGSTLKPFIYGLAFEQGFLHPETEIFDGPDRFGTYGPSNFDGSFHGWISIREALQRSLNLPAVQVLERLGPQRLLSRFAAVDIMVGDERNPGLSLALGGAASSLRDLVALYAALADQGRYRPLRFSPAEPEGPEKRLLSEVAAWYVDDILRTGEHLNEREAALRYKTGTSYGFRDAWALGYTRQYTVGVWVGRPDGGYGTWTTGAEAAVPILRQVVAVLQQGQTGPEPIPPNIVLGRRSELPPQLQRFHRFSQHQGERPRIYFPVDGSTLHLGQNPLLVLKARGGTPPLYWLVNGRPLGREQSQIPLPGVGLHQITVLDSRGRQDKISVWVELDERRP